MGCLRGIFAKYEDQRQWIIEEILSALGKISTHNNVQSRFLLPDGSSIHAISSLLLQLIQASAFGVSARIRKLRSSVMETEGPAPQSNVIDTAEEEIRFCADITESSLKSVRIVAGYLVQKSASTKPSKTTHDTDYKAILDVFVNDLLAVLYRPEWPAASLFLSVLSRLMMSPLEDSKTGVELSAARNIALDYLGNIAARIRSFDLAMQCEGAQSSLVEIISSADVAAASNLMRDQITVQTYLAVSAKDDGMFASSLDMTCVVWAQELQAAIQKITTVTDLLAAEKTDDGEITQQRLTIIAQQSRSALQNLWTRDEGLFEINNPKQSEAAARASVTCSRGRSLQSAYDPILHALVAIMDTPVVALRSKAIRALSSIVTVDPGVLGLAFINRLSDSSPAVRDASVELVGKYVVRSPALATDYYPHIALRVSDSGLAVRKRVIKLLRDIFMTTNTPQIKVDVCCKIILMMGDQDQSVKELATKTLTDMFYPMGATSTALGDAAALLVEVINEYKGSNASLEASLQIVVEECAATGRPDHSVQTVDRLVGRLLDGTEQADFDFMSHIRAILLLCAGQPSIIDASKAAILLTYLRPATTSDQHASNDLLLRIFQRSIPGMPRSASTFAADLQAALMPMIGKPSGGFQTMREVVGCFCAVTNHLTRDYTKLLKLLRACNVRSMQKPLSEGCSSQIQTQAGMTMYITARILEHCDLDAVASNDPNVRQELGTISDRPISEYFYDMFLSHSKMPMSQVAPTTCLGCVFHAYPALILRNETSEWIGDIFAAKDMDNCARVLGVIHGFLASEVERKTSGALHKRNMQALIGSAAEISESGISTAVVQRNIQFILNGATSQHFATQVAALDVLSFIVNQGLSHPLQCLPIIISMETCEDPAIADRALSLHYILHGKHSTLINVRFLDFAKGTYGYQKTITSEVSGHRNGTALLAGWYDVINEKRALRNEFVRALARAFHFELSGDCIPDVGLVLYLADNLATLEYKLLEEVMIVIQQLGSVVSDCTQFVSTLETMSVEGEATDLVKDLDVSIHETSDETRLEHLVNSSIIVGLALLTKNHLLDLYGLAEDKCTKYVIGKKSALGDKPAVRRSHVSVPLDVGCMPWVRGVRTFGEFGQQRATFLRMLQEDGSLGDTNL
ncbi:MAG: Sister chromatid cohesion protein 2 [Tremellales sp. Tagirdzhanova-0007]|nr:MAG: Sister chromatid cohesion protein 2 [Tremellales sp. Tagirdzhanova-0007]